MELIINLIGILNIVLTALSFLFKKKLNVLYCLGVYTILLLVQYILKGSLLETVICAICLVKVLTYIIFEIKHIKPNLVVLICLEMALLVAGILTWENWFSLLFMFSTLLTTFAAWQNNMTLMRILYLFASLLVITNYLFNGLYTMIISEGISVVSTIAGIIMYDILKIKKDKNNDIKNNSLDNYCGESKEV